MYNIDPSQFLNLIRYATYVCTDSFHCSVFSILYEKKFFVFRRFTKETKISTNSRLDTLFQQLEIEIPILTGIEKVQEYMDLRIDYAKIKDNIISFREQSVTYLNEALKNE